MSLFARIFFIAFASFTASCSASRLSRRGTRWNANSLRPTTLVYERHLRRNDEQWSTATRQ
jgi:hypothetical protein